MRGIVKAPRRPRRFARATGGGFPRLSGGVPRGSRCPAPPRHALLAENLWPKDWGTPSLGVNIRDLWYWAFPAYRRGEGCHQIIYWGIWSAQFWLVNQKSCRSFNQPELVFVIIQLLKKFCASGSPLRSAKASSPVVRFSSVGMNS